MHFGSEKIINRLCVDLISEIVVVLCGALKEKVINLHYKICFSV
jgi:hypothetical protein